MSACLVPLAEPERRYADWRRANERLLLAALKAQDLQRSAEEAQRRQTDFLAMLAHELRNPLGPIRTAASVLDRLPAERLPAVRALIERQVAQMARLVDDLLDLSRICTGKLRLEIAAMDLADAIDQGVETCRPALDARRQHLRVLRPAGALALHGDAARLAQVVCNLLDNASKYTPVGGSIELGVVALGGGFVMTVADSGIGMASANLSQVFEPFVQTAQAIDFNKGGLGIGLAVVRELVEGHGGTVVARSAGIGRGSRFVVVLPGSGPSARPGPRSAAAGGRIPS